MLYLNNLKNWIFDFVKASRFKDRKWVHISNIDPLAIFESRDLLLKPKTNFSSCLGIVKKHHYFLIEVLIALSLILLCIVPLMQNPIKFFQSERNSLEKLEYERISDLTFLELKEKLYKNEIPWELKDTKANTPPIALTPFTLKINDDYKKEIPRSYQMWAKREKGNSKETYRILIVQITIGEKEKPNEYKVFVKKTS